MAVLHWLGIPPLLKGFPLCFCILALEIKIVYWYNTKNAKKERIMKKDEIPYKIYLSEDEMPQKWYNVRTVMKNKSAPLLNPGTHKPMTAAELEQVFCDGNL